MINHMNKRTLALNFALAAFVLPTLALAAGDLTQTAVRLEGLVTTATKIVYLLAFLGFFWGLAMVLFNANNDEKRKKGYNVVIIAVVVIFIMTSIWGIVRLLQGTLGADQNQQIDLVVPKVRVY